MGLSRKFKENVLVGGFFLLSVLIVVVVVAVVWSARTSERSMPAAEQLGH